MVFGGLPNKTAAMPSLHAGIAFLVAFYAIAQAARRVALAAAALPGRDGLALVYSAEHYLIDAIMGGVIAALAMVGCAWWDRRRGEPDGVSGTSRAPRR